jgi:hypothetical protein
MKKTTTIFALMLMLQQCMLAQCFSGSYTVTGNVTITGSCVITGDLTIPNGATLNVDLTSVPADTFVVRGNILLQGDAVLWIHGAPGSTGEQFIVSNSTNNQRTITTLDSSRIKLEYIEFRTQEGNLSGAASFYMNYNAEDKSIFYVNKCWLDPQKAWMLFNMRGHSTFMGYESNEVPTEMYIQDSAQAAIHGPNTTIGIWAIFDAVTDTLTLPSDQSQPYTWQIGRGAGGLATQWYLEVDTAKPGLGIQIMPSANITVNGSGSTSTKELTVALLFANGTDTIKNLAVGLQNTTVANGANGSVTLNNVNLGPIAWQLYIVMNEILYIKNSIINEMGIAGPSQVTVDSSLFQLAVLASVGAGGSTLTVNNSEIWSQSITASNNSTLTLNNCQVTGSIFDAASGSHITVNGGCFYDNPQGCTINTMVDMNTGHPNCNFFIPPGPPQNTTPSTVTFSGVNSNCTTGTNENLSSETVTIFPNPSTNTINVTLPYTGLKYSIEMYSLLGQQVMKTSDKTSLDVSGIPAGIYTILIKQNDKIWVTKAVKQ